VTLVLSPILSRISSRSGWPATGPTLPPPAHRHIRMTALDGASSPELVKVVEVDDAKTTVLSSATIPCVNRTATSVISDATGDGIYKVFWDVDVLVA
jgi:hypothetical protein